jgi:hypothetical protein
MQEAGSFLEGVLSEGVSVRKGQAPDRNCGTLSATGLGTVSPCWHRFRSARVSPRLCYSWRCLLVLSRFSSQVTRCQNRLKELRSLCLIWIYLLRFCKGYAQSRFERLQITVGPRGPQGPLALLCDFKGL